MKVAHSKQLIENVYSLLYFVEQEMFVILYGRNLSPSKKAHALVMLCLVVKLLTLDLVAIIAHLRRVSCLIVKLLRVDLIEIPVLWIEVALGIVTGSGTPGMMIGMTSKVLVMRYLSTRFCPVLTRVANQIVKYPLLEVYWVCVRFPLPRRVQILLPDCLMWMKAASDQIVLAERH